MTRQQIDYWNLQETKRHNMATEGQNWYGLKETARHNVATEALTSRGLDETQRHNIATEGYSYASLNETKRHNLATESLTRSNINLGYSTLAETTRHNKMNEQIAAVTQTNNTAIGVYNAETARKQYYQTVERDWRNYELGVGNYLVNAVGALGGRSGVVNTFTSADSQNYTKPVQSTTQSTTTSGLFDSMFAELNKSGGN